MSLCLSLQHWTVSFLVSSGQAVTTNLSGVQYNHAANVNHVKVVENDFNEPTFVSNCSVYQQSRERVQQS